MQNELTREEQAAIRRLRKAFERMPESLLVYVLDDTAYVCKKGVPSEEIAEHVACWLAPCAVLRDAHDGMGRGA